MKGLDKCPDEVTMSFIDYIFVLISILINLYLLWYVIGLINIPDENWDEFRKFKGNGRGLKIDKDGNVICVKYRTHEDHRRFLEGMRVIDLHDDK